MRRREAGKVSARNLAKVGEKDLATQDIFSRKIKDGFFSDLSMDFLFIRLFANNFRLFKIW